MFNLQTFGCSNESSPNSSCHFWNDRVRVYSKFASLFSVMKDNSSVFFLAQTSYTLDKNSPLKWNWNFQTFEWMGEKSPNSSCHNWNHKSVFLSTLHHSSMSWEISLLYFYMIFTEGTHDSAKFQTFDCSGEISPNLYFDRLLFLKVYKVSAKKKYGKNMSHDTKVWSKTS